MKRKEVCIIDYGMGNLGSLKNALNYLNAKVVVTNKHEDILKSKILFLPGVGSFKKAMDEIKIRKLDKAIYESVKKGHYIFGICLGMQLLGNSSNEDGLTKGLGIIKNKILKFSDKETQNKKIPHVGFNSVNFKASNKLFRGLENNSDFYFVHSYRMLPERLKDNITITKYGVNFLSSFNQENIYATQFHPEKSQGNGLKVLENFISLT